jgi:hypothetical protein
MALHKIFVTVTPTNISPAASSVLQEGWVQMYDIPDEAKGLEAVTAIAERAGEVIVVDEVSLIKIGPARVKIRARDISKVKGFLEIFIEGIGHYIRFIPELPKKKTPDLDLPAKNKNQEGEGVLRMKMMMICMILMMTLPKNHKALRGIQALMVGKGSRDSRATNTRLKKSEMKRGERRNITRVRGPPES